MKTAVVGGGAIGAAVASACARRGVQVSLLERGALAGRASALDLALLPRETDPGPYLDLHHFTGGAFFLDRSPPDAWPARRIGARAAVAAMAAEARSHGADVRTGCDVKALLVRGSSVRGVLTDAGELSADAVVLAAGVDAWHLLAPHGIDGGGELDEGDLVVARPADDVTDPFLEGAAWAAPDGAGLLHVARPEAVAAQVGLDGGSVLERRRLTAAVGVAGPIDGLAGLFLALAPDAWGIARAPAIAVAVAGWALDG